MLSSLGLWTCFYVEDLHFVVFGSCLTDLLVMIGLDITRFYLKTYHVDKYNLINFMFMRRVNMISFVIVTLNLFSVNPFVPAICVTSVL